jgi:hypothetical protein
MEDQSSRYQTADWSHTFYSMAFHYRPTAPSRQLGRALVYGVVIVDWLVGMATPKSSSTTRPSSHTNTSDALTSRWITPRLCAAVSGDLVTRMIQTLAEVVDVTRRQAASLARHGVKQPTLTGSGVDLSQLVEIQKRFPATPANYLAVLRHVDPVGVVVGLYTLSPGNTDRDLVSGLVEANEPRWRYSALASSESALVVAAREGDVIGVALETASRPPGEVLLLDISTGFNRVNRIARDYETLLLLIGNLRSAEMDLLEKRCTGSEADQCFSEVSAHFFLRDDEISFWHDE